jgi:hypothetical protein
VANAIRVDGLLDGGDRGKLYIGSSTGHSPNYESVDEAIEDLTYDHGEGVHFSATTRDVTAEVMPEVIRRGEFRYAPKDLKEVRFIEVTSKKVVAVHDGAKRPTR